MSPPRSAPCDDRPPPLGPIHYRVEPLDLYAHLFRVELTVPVPEAEITLSLPVWIPGSYLVREFSQHLLQLEATVDGVSATLRQTRKNRWRVTVPPGARAAVLRYQVYAFDACVRTAFLDQTRGFFNPTSLCLRVEGREHEPHRLQVQAPKDRPDWEVATALPPLKTGRKGFGTFVASGYDELADSPVAMGPCWSGQFDLRGVVHRFVVTGEPAGFDGVRLLRDTQAVCDAALELWHGADPPPFDRYLFLLHASAQTYGGLEHRHSTALICPRADLPLLEVEGKSPTPLQASDGYTSLLGLIGHEYFHAWNVKRLRPQEFTTYDYDQENHTRLLWFFEGFTSYYDDLLLLRAGLIDEAAYLQSLAKTINQVQQTPGRQVQSVAQASFEAWTKYYRMHENTPNATVSYYSKGALVALCLDLSLRADGHACLDAVMRALYARCQGGPMQESDLLAVLQQLGQRSYAQELQDWVHGVSELPLRALLEAAGVQWQEEPAPVAQQLGLRLHEQDGIVLKHVLRGGAAEAAGLAAHDEWLGVELPGTEHHAASAWRVRKLDEVALHARGQRQITAIVARDGRLLRCPLDWPPASTTVRLTRAAVAAAPGAS